MPWILASAVLVHGGCTTGMEAFVADHPALALRPNDNPWHGCFLSNLVNPNMADAAAAGRAALDIVTDSRTMQNTRPDYLHVLADHVAAIDGDLSADLIVDALSRRQPTENALPHWQPAYDFIESQAMSPVQRAKMSTTMTAIETEMACLAAIQPELAAVKIREVGQSMFHIYM